MSSASGDISECSALDPRVQMHVPEMDEDDGPHFGNIKDSKDTDKLHYSKGVKTKILQGDGMGETQSTLATSRSTTHSRKGDTRHISTKQREKAAEGGGGCCSGDKACVIF